MEQIPDEVQSLKKRHIAILTTVALFFDMLSIIPGGNVFVALFGQTIIPFIFSRYGINIFAFKSIAPFIVASFIEFIPGASVLPAFTLETIIIIYLYRRQSFKKLP